MLVGLARSPVSVVIQEYAAKDRAPAGRDVALKTTPSAVPAGPGPASPSADGILNGASPESASLPRRPGRWRARVSWFLLATLLAFLLAEAALRLCFFEQLKINKLPLIYMPDRTLGYRYIPNADGEISVPSISKRVRINANGYYGPGFSLHKKEGVFRIAVVGSSNESGIWMDGTRTFEMELQRLFREAGRKVEVLNCGMDGNARALANLRMITGDVLRYAPDLVLLNVDIPIAMGVIQREMYRGYIHAPGSSDTPEERMDQTRREIHAYIDDLEDMAVTRIYDVSFVVRAVHRLLRRMPGSSGGSMLEHDNLLRSLERYKTKRVRLLYSLGMLSVEDSIKRIQRTQEAVEQSGGELVLFWYWDEAQMELHATGLEEQLRSADVPYILLRMPRDRALVHEHDGHYSERGHAVIAERLFNELQRRGYPK